MEKKPIEIKTPPAFAYSLSPQEYDGLLRFINMDNLLRLKNMIPKLPPRDIAIIVVGSDGKLERHPQSQTEIVVLSTYSKLALEISKTIKDYLVIHHPYEHFDLEPKGIPEYKALNNGYMSYAYNNPNLVYPDRMLNSILIAGDRVLYNQARIETLEEMGGDSEVGKKIRYRLKKQLSSHRVACTSGIYNREVIFDKDSNKQIYDEKNKKFGFKMAFLRAVQRRLDVIMARAIIDKIINPQEIISGFLPTNTIDRLDFLFKHNLIEMNSQQFEDLIEGYLWFLQRYHEIQETYKNKGSTIELKFDNLLFVKYQKIIVDFVTLK